MTLRIIARFPIIHRIVHRLRPHPYIAAGVALVSCPMCAYVWRRLEGTPGFSARLAAARAELEAGGGYRWEDL